MQQLSKLNDQAKYSLSYVCVESKSGISKENGGMQSQIYYSFKTLCRMIELMHYFSAEKA